MIEWHVHPARADRWLEAWRPAAARAMAFGASSWTLVRSIDDPHHFRQTATWRDRADFERYWFSDELCEIRERVLNLYNKPVSPDWYKLLAAEE